jgi:hypothetical protein
VAGDRAAAAEALFRLYYGSIKALLRLRCCGRRQGSCGRTSDTYSFSWYAGHPTPHSFHTTSAGARANSSAARTRNTHTSTRASTRASPQVHSLPLTTQHIGSLVWGWRTGWGCFTTGLRRSARKRSCNTYTTADATWARGSV